MSAAIGAGREIGVIGSARIEPPDARWDQAHELGGLLAQAGFTIVTGGYGGLMAAASHGAHERGGRVVGLPMRQWERVKPNRWNTELRWCDGYGVRLEHLLACFAVVALPGGVGTLSELSVVWAAAQTEAAPPSIVLLGDEWTSLITAIGKHLVVGPEDLELLRVVASPREVVEALALPADRSARPGPRG